MVNIVPDLACAILRVNSNGGDARMTAHGVLRLKVRRKSRSLVLPLALLGVVALGAGSFVAYMLWPTWPAGPAALDAPTVPVTVAGILFNVPPGAIRAGVQRHPGAHERIDLVFLWPSLSPPQPGDAARTVIVNDANGLPVPPTDDRLFVTIAGLGGVLAPSERLRSIYPRYIEAQAAPGPDRLAILPFRAGTPYEGEDLVYDEDKPEQFFARCTRTTHVVRGTCIYEHSLGAAEVTLRFPRDWLEDWRNVADGCDRLMATLHPQADDTRARTNNR